MGKYRHGMLGAAQREHGIFESQVENLLAAARRKAKAIRQCWREGDDQTPHPQDVAVVVSCSKPSMKAAGGPSIQLRVADLEYTDVLIGYCDQRITWEVVRRALVAVIGYDPQEAMAPRHFASAKSP